MPVLPDVPLMAAASSVESAARPLVTAKSTHLPQSKLLCHFCRYGRLNETVSVRADASSLNVTFIPGLGILHRHRSPLFLL